MPITENSFIVMMPIPLIKPENRIRLEDLTSEELVRLHGNTAIAAFRQRVYYEMRYDLRQLEDGRNELAAEIVRRIGGSPAPAQSGAGGGDGRRTRVLAAAHVQIKDLQAKLAPPQQQAQRRLTQLRRKSRGMEM